MKKRLGFFERERLIRQGIKDQNESAFFSYQPPDSPKGLFLSSFMFCEIMQLSSDVRWLFDRRWCVVALWSNTRRRYFRLMHLSEALSLIDARVTQLEDTMQAISLRYEAPLRELGDLCMDAGQRHALHMEAMYRKRYSEMEERLKQELLGYERVIKFLLTEKIRLLQNTFVRYNTLLGRQFLRIQYYYQVSCQGGAHENYPPFSMDDCRALMDKTVPEQFEKELMETRDALRRLERSHLRFPEPEEGE